MAEVSTFYQSKYTGEQLDEILKNVYDAVPLDGSKPMTAPLTIKEVENGYTQLEKNHTQTTDLGTALRDVSKGGGVVALLLKAADQAARLQFGTSVYELIHSGNIQPYVKPFADAAEAASEEAAAALAGVRDAINNIPDGAATPIVNDLTTGGTSMALSAEMGKVLKGELDTRVNPNLLDNWYFGNPVDQRGGYVVPPGVTVYSDTALTNKTTSPTSSYRVVELKGSYAQFWWASENRYLYVAASDCVRGYTTDAPLLYGFDRWKLCAGSICKGTDSWRFISKTTTSTYPRIVQLGEGTLKARTTYTLSALVDIHSYTGDVRLRPCSSALANVSGASVYIITSADVGTKKLISVTFTPSADAPNFGVEILCLSNTGAASIDVDIYAMKLELGTQQTLAHKDANGNWVLNEIPDYNEQLLRCCMSTADSGDTYANNAKTPSAVNAFGVAGNIESGADLNTYINVGAYTATSSVTSTLKNSPITSGATQLMVFKTSDSAVNSLVQIFTKTSTSDNDFYWRKHANGSWSNWVILATTDYAVPLDGSKAMTGALGVSGGYGRVTASSGGTAGVSVRSNPNDAANYTYIGVYSYEAIAKALKLYRYIDGTPNEYTVLHTGNKPIGSYTGNGDATGRTIDTGGIGHALSISSAYGFAIVTPSGAIVRKGNSIFALNAGFVNGVLTINTVDTCINAQGTTYTYQVL